MISKVIIGRRELANFPALGLKNIVVKTDSGAYTSSIHCSFIEVNGSTVTCIFLDDSNEAYTGKKETFSIIKNVKVKSSNGEDENRCMIQTTIEILGKDYPIDLTLTNRMDMRYPVLLGRKFLADRFLVDVSLKFQTND